jgi:CRP/FNR family cyclic AMP-dependent transcriptional regulator
VIDGRFVQAECLPSTSSDQPGRGQRVAAERQQALFSEHGQLYPRGTVVVRQGDHGGHLYLIVRGELDVSIRGEKEGESTVVRRAGPGQFLGVTSCFTGLPHTATLTAASNAFVLRLPPGAVDELVHANPNFAIAVIEELVDRLRSATVRSVEAAHAPTAPPAVPPRTD